MSGVRAASSSPGMPTSHMPPRCGQLHTHSHMGSTKPFCELCFRVVGRVSPRTMWDGLFIPLQPKTTHTHSDVHTNPSSRKVVFPATTGPQHPDTPRLGDVPTGCPDLGRRPAAGGSALPHKLRGRGKDEATPGDLPSACNPAYSATLLGPGAGGGSVSTTWWMTRWSQPTVVRRE